MISTRRCGRLLRRRSWRASLNTRSCNCILGIYGEVTGSLGVSLRPLESYMPFWLGHSLRLSSMGRVQYKPSQWYFTIKCWTRGTISSLLASIDSTLEDRGHIITANWVLVPSIDISMAVLHSMSFASIYSASNFKMTLVYIRTLSNRSTSSYYCTYIVHTVDPERPHNSTSPVFTRPQRK